MLLILPIVSTIAKAHVFRQLVPLWWLLGAVVVVVLGMRAERRAAASLERPLRLYERFFDVALHKPMPFSSFMMVQMTWWAIAFIVAAGTWIRYAA